MPKTYGQLLMQIEDLRRDRASLERTITDKDQEIKDWKKKYEMFKTILVWIETWAVANYKDDVVLALRDMKKKYAELYNGQGSLTGRKPGE